MLSHRSRGVAELLVATSFVFLLAKCTGPTRTFPKGGAGVAGESGSGEAGAAGADSAAGSGGEATPEGGAAGYAENAGNGGSGEAGEGGSAGSAGSDSVSPYPTQLAIGLLHICALISDGHVYCWGGGWLGNGTGSSEGSATPVHVTGISNAIQIAVGGSTSCALLADHTLKCWGQDSTGQISGGSASDGYLTPTTVAGLTGVSDVLTTGATSCARLSNGTVRCWGSGDGNAIAPTAIRTMSPLTGATRLGGEICSVISDKTLRCWEGANGTPTSQDGLPTNITQAAGKCALSSDGSVRCWGPGSSGQIGNGLTVDQATPQKVQPLGTATWIGAGTTHVCAILADQSFWCWGKDGFFSPIDYGSKPLAIDGLGKVAAAAAAMDNTCVIETDHTVKCWGSNLSGYQIGENGPSGNAMTPVVITGLPGGN